MPKRASKPTRRASEVVEAYHGAGEKTDPQGSYTGLPIEARMMIDPADPRGTRYRPLSEEQKKKAEPVQDADDL